MKKKSLLTLLVTAVAGSALLFGFVAATAVNDPGPADRFRLQPAAAMADARPAAAQKSYYEQRSDAPVPTITLPDFADIFERVSPAVVSISATKFNDERRGRFFDDPFHWFFGPDRERQRPNEPRREESGGTGFVITPDGYILTNYHVIEGADVVRVQLRAHGHTNEYEGRVVGADPPTDIALVKISPDKDLSYLPLGDSDRLRVGEWVMAIGNPYFYEDTVTVGVVSAKGRRLAGLSRDPSLDDYIQTDAAINVGNSGGPLLNLHGEVIGINTAVSRIGQGIGFAIPIGIAKIVVPQLRESGRVSRGAIGVTITDFDQLSDEQREYFAIDQSAGALVQDVTDGKAADRAGLRPGDAIVAFDGESLEGSSDLIGRISAHRPGDTIELTILRNGRRMVKEVRLEDREDLYQNASVQREEDSEQPGGDIIHRIGIRVEPLDAETRERFDIGADINGAVIADVSVRGAAYEQGLRPGMVILEVNRERIGSIGDYRRALEGVDGGGLVTFYVWTRNSRSFFTFRID